MAQSIYDSIKSAVAVTRDKELYFAIGLNAERISFGSQHAAFIANVSAIFYPTLNSLSQVDNAASVVFRPALKRLSDTLFQIFGKIPTRAMADSFSLTDKVVDGRLAKQWGSDLLSAATAADGIVIQQERENRDPFGLGRGLGFDSFQTFMIAGAVIVGGLALMALGD